MKLKGKCAVVTGAGRGIGQAIAERFASEGARIVIADIDGTTAQATAEAIQGSGGEATALRTDVGDPEQANAMIAAAVRSYGAVDILVNNAGIAPNRLVLDTSLEEWERVMRTNLTGTFLCCKAAANAMKERDGGRIINIASVSGQRGGVGRGVYGTSKAGIIMLTRIMAVEFAPMNIAVNAIAPGPIRTDMTDHSDGTVKSYMDRIPMGRYGTKEAVAAATLYLACEDSSYTTGITLNVDGGFDAAGIIFPQGDLSEC